MALEGLKLISAPKKEILDDAGKRRARLVMQIDKQVYFVSQEKEGRQSRGRWWTRDPDGRPILAIKYGKVALELAKGKHAVACESLDHVIEALKVARAAVTDGKFDDQLQAISANVRSRFKKG